MTKNFNGVFKEVVLDTSGLAKDMLVKNYKHMCKLLGENCRTGRAKILQIEEWERYFSYERIRTSYKIIEIYETTLPKTRKLPMNTIIRNLIIVEDLVNFYLDDNSEINETYKTTKELYVLLGICNEAFYEYKKLSEVTLKYNQDGIDKFNDSIFEEVNQKDLRNFYDEVSNRGRWLLSDLMKKLDKQTGVEIQKSFEVYIRASEEPRLCTDKEKLKIEKVKTKILGLEKYCIKNKNGDFETQTENDLALKKRLKEFYKDIYDDEEFKSSGIIKFYTAYKFSFDQNIVSVFDQYKSQLNSIDEYEKELNIQSVLYHIDKTEDITDKNLNKFNLLLQENPRKSCKEILEENRITGLHYGYHSSRMLLIDKLIKQYEDIRVESKKEPIHKNYPNDLKQFKLNRHESEG